VLTRRYISGLSPAKSGDAKGANLLRASKGILEKLTSTPESRRPYDNTLHNTNHLLVHPSMSVHRGLRADDMARDSCDIRGEQR
jgi:hypothetical protein